MPGVNTPSPPAIGSLLQPARTSKKKPILEMVPWTTSRTSCYQLGSLGNTLCRGYWRILAETESVSGEGRKTGQRKKLNWSAVVAEVSAVPWGALELGWLFQDTPDWVCLRMKQWLDKHGPRRRSITLGKVSLFGWGQFWGAPQLRGIIHNSPGNRRTK